MVSRDSYIVLLSMVSRDSYIVLLSMVSRDSYIVLLSMVSRDSHRLLCTPTFFFIKLVQNVHVGRTFVRSLQECSVYVYNFALHYDTPITHVQYTLVKNV